MDNQPAPSPVPPPTDPVNQPPVAPPQPAPQPQPGPSPVQSQPVMPPGTSSPARRSKGPIIIALLVIVLIVVAAASYALVSQKKTSYQTVIKNFITDIQNKDKAKADALQSPHFTNSLKGTVGVASFEGYCQSIGELCTGFFANSYFAKATTVTKSYGSNGKQVVYSVNSPASHSSGSLNCSVGGTASSLTIAVVPSGNSWLVDNVDPSLSASNINCLPAGRAQ